jgi:hypothetical protein
VRLCGPILIFCALRWVGFPSSSGEADPPCGDLRGLLLIRDFIVHFQPLERCRFRRIQSEFLDLFAEELLLFWVIVEAACLDLVSPASDFLRSFLFARLVEPFDYFLVASALFDLLFEIVAFTPLKPKTMLSSGQSK